MLKKLSGYRVCDLIYANDKTLVYRAEDLFKAQPVVLKLLHNPYPTVRELTQLRHQFAIAQVFINTPGIIQVQKLEPYENSYILVMEDFGGISLLEEMQHWGGQALGATAEGIQAFLQIALQIAKILDSLHRQRVIHRDIKPANFLINPNTREVKLIDFSIASRMPKSIQSLVSASALEGTLAYISPEQTGRMNRGIDYRTDFYSFGIACYELLTGQLPFQAADLTDLVYCHLAKQAVPAHHVQAHIPEGLSQIIDRLMAKNAEDRYQSASGLQHDFAVCLAQWQETGTIDPFELGQYDVADRLIIPEKLYGRQRDVAILRDVFDRVTDGTRSSELVLIAGPSGIGKTTVVKELQKAIVEQRGYFSQGKYEPLQRNLPFSGFIQALGDLTRQLLTESDGQLERWRLKIMTALGENSQILIEVIPELAALLGPQPPVSELTGSAEQNRFNLVIQKFIQVFTQPAHPMVMFLDDLQWADMESLALIERLMNDIDQGYLFVIAAYRDGEVSPTHPLRLALEQIQSKTGDRLQTIALEPLGFEDLNGLIADTIHNTCDHVEPLTQLIYQKTNGNPFFVNQFLKMLYEEGLIYVRALSCEPTGGKRHGGLWQYDLEKIRALALTTDVVEFVALQLQKLPDPTQTALQLAACIGNAFDLATLAIVANQSTPEIAQALWFALEAGLILPDTTLDLDLDRGLAADHGISALGSRYHFLHDRIQQAAYGLIHPEKRQLTHLKIGQLLLSHRDLADGDRYLFEIANQLNAGSPLITQPQEQVNLAELNLAASRKAKAVTGYKIAMDYAQRGLDLLGVAAWQRDYALTLALYTEAVETAYLGGDFEGMEAGARMVIHHASTLLDRVKIYEIKIQALSVQNQSLEAIELALSVLGQLDIVLPSTPTNLEIEAAFERTRSDLTGRTVADLVDLPCMVDTQMQAAMRILSLMVGPAYITSPGLLPLVILKQVNLSIIFGNDSLSAFSYACYALLLCGINLDIQLGTQFGDLALEVLERFDVQPSKVKTMHVVYGHAHVWNRPLTQVLQPLQTVFQLGLDQGDLEYAGYAATHYGFCAYFTGQPLEPLELKLGSYIQTLTQSQQTTSALHLTLYHEAITVLLGKLDPAEDLLGLNINPDRQAYLQRKNDRLGLFYLHLNQLFLGCLGQNQALTLEQANLAEQYLDGATGLALLPIFYFYAALAHLSAYPTAEAEAKVKILQRVESYQAKLGVWRSAAAMNYDHKIDLVKAECHRVLGEFAEAIDAYDRAIASAIANGYVQEEAIANELAARFYQAWGKDKIAQVYLIDAYYAYARWGAKAKIDDLEQRYPALLSLFLQGQYGTHRSLSTTQTSTNETASGGKSSTLDIMAIERASQALMGEIKLDKLLSRLIDIVSENAGAEICALVLPQEEDTWMIAAHRQGTQNSVVLQPVPLHRSHDLPQTIINYVLRTGETLTLDDATKTQAFASDPYIQAHKSKSVLCTSIVNQGKVLGILYLENNLAPGIFTRDRLEIIRLIITQAAVSLENATLYQTLAIANDCLADHSHTLEQKVFDRTQELHAKHQFLEQTLAELKNTQSQLIQVEKMSGLGQIVAGIAHEINNPINFIHGNLTHTSQYIQDLLDVINTYQQEHPQRTPVIEDKLEEVNLDFLVDDLPKMLQSMKTGCDRIRTIILSLRTFSRLDEAAMKPVSIHDGIDSTLMILEHRLQAQLKRPAISIHRVYGQLPKVMCYASQMNQVLMNILNNAIDALELAYSDRQKNAARQLVLVASTATEEIDCAPTIHIHTELLESNRIRIRITDNGPGIPETIRSKIFDPFFTTKPVGSGTGLGLAVCYQIVVAKHGGMLSFQSDLHQGTTFMIEIPVGEDH